MLGLLGILAACDSPVAPAPATPEASVIPSASPTAAPTTSPLSFRDDFDGTALDPQRWHVFARTGIVQVGGGMLELANSRNQQNYPYVLAMPAVLPTTGPVFSEVAFKVLTPGSVSFCLDFLPTENPDERPLTQPFMRTFFADNQLKVGIEMETGFISRELAGALDPDKFHVLRFENHGNNHCRVIWDQQEILRFDSRYRPTRFWIGSHPIADTRARDWPRVLVDYVELGVLTSPASVPIAPGATPEPSVSSSVSASPLPS